MTRGVDCDAKGEVLRKSGAIGMTGLFSRKRTSRHGRVLAL